MLPPASAENPHEAKWQRLRVKVATKHNSYANEKEYKITQPSPGMLSTLHTYMFVYVCVFRCRRAQVRHSKQSICSNQKPNHWSNKSELHSVCVLFVREKMHEIDFFSSVASTNKQPRKKQQSQKNAAVLLWFPFMRYDFQLFCTLFCVWTVSCYFFCQPCSHLLDTEKLSYLLLSLLSSCETCFLWNKRAYFRLTWEIERKKEWFK